MTLGSGRILFPWWSWNPSKIEWGLTNRPLSKLRSSYSILRALGVRKRCVLLEVAWIFGKLGGVYTWFILITINLMKKKELVHHKKKGGSYHIPWILVEALSKSCAPVGSGCDWSQEKVFFVSFPLYLLKTQILPISNAGLLLEC